MIHEYCYHKKQSRLSPLSHCLYISHKFWLFSFCQHRLKIILWRIWVIIFTKSTKLSVLGVLNEWETTVYFWIFFGRLKILLNPFTYSALSWQCNNVTFCNEIKLVTASQCSAVCVQQQNSLNQNCVEEAKTIFKCHRCCLVCTHYTHIFHLTIVKSQKLGRCGSQKLGPGQKSREKKRQKKAEKLAKEIGNKLSWEKGRQSIGPKSQKKVATFPPIFWSLWSNVLKVTSLLVLIIIHY